MKKLKIISLMEWMYSLIISVLVFLLLGTTTALWDNSYFIRMTEVNGWDYIILSLESMLIGLFFGVRVPTCAVKKAGLGGVLGFIGFGCSICNKILLYLFGASFLLSYFEPVRHYFGAFGILLFSYAIFQRLSLRQSSIKERNYVNDDEAKLNLE